MMIATTTMREDAPSAVARRRPAPGAHHARTAPAAENLLGIEAECAHVARSVARGGRRPAAAVCASAHTRGGALPGPRQRRCSRSLTSKGSRRRRTRRVTSGPHLDHVGLLLAEHLLDGVGDDHPLADRRDALAERLGHARGDDGEVELVRLLEDGEAVVEPAQADAPLLAPVVELHHALHGTACGPVPRKRARLRPRRRRPCAGVAAGRPARGPRPRDRHCRLARPQQRPQVLAGGARRRQRDLLGRARRR